MIAFAPALLAFVCSSSLAAAAMSLAYGQLAPAISIAALAIGALAAGFAGRAFAPAAERERWSLRAFSPGGDGALEGILLILAFGFAVRHFAYLIYRSDTEMRALNANNIGDLPMHFEIIRFVAQGARWPLLNPIFSGEVLRYPLGADLHAALWESIGVPSASHLAWVGVALTAATLLLLRSWASWWGIAALYFAGGWAGWSAPAGTDWQAHVAWKNLFLAALATQRGLLFGAPIGLLLLIRFRAAFLRGESLPRAERFWLGFLWGALAFFHPHSFVAVSLLIGGYALIGAGRSSAAWREALRQAALPLAIAIPLGGFWCLHASGWLQRASIAHLSWGWTRGTQGWPSYLGDNFGPWLLALALSCAAMLWGPARAGKSEGRKLAWELALYLALFALFFNVMLAPWEWDNVKLLIWPALGFALIARETIGPALRQWFGAEDEGSHRRAAVGMALAAAAFVMSAAGARALFEASASNSRSVLLFTVADLAKAEGAIARAPIDAVFVAKPSFDHALAYWGRARAVGYDGHLWSHGIDYGPATLAAERVLRGDPDWAHLLETLHATHIFWGPTERAAYGEAPKPWQSRLTDISGVPGYAVYEFVPGHASN